MRDTIWCFIICFGAVDSVPAPPIDSYCSTYQQVVLNRVELALVLKLPRQMRDKLQGNELEFLCRCRGWKDKACEVKEKT